MTSDNRLETGSGNQTANVILVKAQTSGDSNPAYVPSETGIGEARDNDARLKYQAAAPASWREVTGRQG